MRAQRSSQRSCCTWRTPLTTAVPSLQERSSGALRSLDCATAALRLHDPGVPSLVDAAVLPWFLRMFILKQYRCGPEQPACPLSSASKATSVARDSHRGFQLPARCKKLNAWYGSVRNPLFRLLLEALTSSTLCAVLSIVPSAGDKAASCGSPAEGS